MISEEIKPVAKATIEVRLSKGISWSFDQSVESLFNEKFLKFNCWKSYVKTFLAWLCLTNTALVNIKRDILEQEIPYLMILIYSTTTLLYDTMSMIQ